MKDIAEDTMGDGKDTKTANMSRRAAVFYLGNIAIHKFILYPYVLLIFGDAS